ncbi:GTPase IMAP family member 9-like [Brachyhypopomus gauderio]|uniref:GTPase IMAP family member 9-like n=1 Tax=Brachyhypopomus gauderio TaxID=698409 RepID=UPI0040428FFC
MDKQMIVLLGKTGDGKSSCGNLILGEKKFPPGSSALATTKKCISKTKSINDKNIQIIDTPGFFDTKLSSEKRNREILRCIIKCAPGPHAFVIVLKVGRYTKHERETVEEITKSFGEEALKYAVVLFTFGDQLCEGQTIEDFVNQSTELQDLVNKCGGRVHVVDNKYWNEQQDGYRSNRVQVEKLLKTIEEMVKENGGECYTNEMLQAVQKAVDAEYMALCGMGKWFRDINMIEQAKQNIFTKLLRIVGIGTGVLLGAFFGAVAGGAAVVTITKELGIVPAIAITPAGLVVGAVVGAGVGAVAGGSKGYQAAEGAETMTDTMNTAYKETHDFVENAKRKAKQISCKGNHRDYHKFD